MNIAFLLRPWPIFGGGETVTLALANEFVKRGHDVFVVYTDWNDAPNMPYIDERIHNIHAKCLSGVFSKGKTVCFPKTLVQSADSFLGDFSKDNDIDFIINQWWPCETTVKARKYTQIIKCNHTTLFFKENRSDFGWSLKGIIKHILGENLCSYINKKKACKGVFHDLQFCDKYVFLAKAFIDDFLSFTKSFQYIDKLDFCNNPLPFDLSYRKDELKNKRDVVLFVGRMSESSKKVSKILKVWKAIEGDERFVNWKLKLVGSGPSEEFYKFQSESLNLKQIEFEGHQYPLDYYIEAKIFLMTSAKEGWGMTLVESQENGVVPVVLDTFSSLQDIITNEKNGIIIERHNLNEFVKSLKKLMLDNSLREKMAINGLRSCSKFDIKNICDKWDLIFNQLKVK